MKTWLLASAALLAAYSLPGEARADVITLGASGAGVSITMTLTYSPTSPQGVLDQQPNTNYPVNSYHVTGISGTFTDQVLGIFNAPIGGVFATIPPHNPLDPPGTNTLAPPSLSFIPVAFHPPKDVVSYDNLFYPGGSPQTANNWQFSGGFFDIYGLAFTLQGTDYVVDFWSAGNNSFAGPGLQYGMAVVDLGTLENELPTVVRDLFGGISVPEPASMLVLGTGLLGLGAARRRSRR